MRSVVVSWASFVSLAERALPAMRCPVAPADNSGAREAHWDTPDSLAGALAARGLEFIQAVSHMPCRLPASRFPQVCRFEPGRLPPCVSEQAPACFVPCPYQCGRRCRFPTSPLPVLRCRTRRWRSFLTPELPSSHNACFCGRKDLDRCKTCEAYVSLCVILIVGFHRDDELAADEDLS